MTSRKVQKLLTGTTDPALEHAKSQVLTTADLRNDHEKAINFISEFADARESLKAKTGTIAAFECRGQGQGGRNGWAEEATNVADAPVAAATEGAMLMMQINQRSIARMTSGIRQTQKKEPRSVQKERPKVSGPTTEPVEKGKCLHWSSDSKNSKASIAVRRKTMTNLAMTLEIR